MSLHRKRARQSGAELNHGLEELLTSVGHQENASTLEVPNGSRIVCLPRKEATVRTCSKVSLLVIDEASRVADDLYYAVRPVLAVPGGLLIRATRKGQK